MDSLHTTTVMEMFFPNFFFCPASLPISRYRPPYTVIYILPGQFPTAWLWFFFLSFFAIDHRGGFSLSISSLVYCWWRPQSRDPQWPRNVYIISIISPTSEKVYRPVKGKFGPLLYTFEALIESRRHLFTSNTKSGTWKLCTWSDCAIRFNRTRHTPN
jgi:hypothetical protein